MQTYEFKTEFQIDNIVWFPDIELGSVIKYKISDIQVSVSDLSVIRYLCQRQGTDANEKVILFEPEIYESAIDAANELIDLEQ